MSDAEKPIIEYEDDPWQDGTEMEFVTEADEVRETTSKTAQADELLKRIEELQRQSETNRGTDVAQLREAVEGLGAKISPQPVKQPEETWDEFNTRLREQLLGDKPADVLREAVVKVLGGDLRTIAENLGSVQGTLMTQHPKLGSTYQRYKGEVDAAVVNRPDRFRNPNVYVEETERVTARHLEEIIQEEVQKQLKGANGGQTSAEYSEHSSLTPPKPPTRAKRQYKITAEHERRREALGMTREAYYPRANRGI